MKIDDLKFLLRQCLEGVLLGLFWVIATPFLIAVWVHKQITYKKEEALSPEAQQFKQKFINTAKEIETDGKHKERPPRPGTR
jgi:hypothetical protein